MKLDRDLQRKVLLACADIYPQAAEPKSLVAACGSWDVETVMANVTYLAEHGLVASELRRYIGGPPAMGLCTITARGLDFLADDGGLSAILGVVTVKLHADTVRDMLLVKAEASALPPEEKSALRRQIAALPGTALQALTTRAAQEGLAHIPDLWQWIRGVTGL